MSRFEPLKGGGNSVGGYKKTYGLIHQSTLPQQTK